MATEITVQVSFGWSVGGITGGIGSQAPIKKTYAFTDPETFACEPQAMSTSFADIDLDAVGWTNGTWLVFKNLSSTDGEDITIIAYPVVGGDASDDGSVAGASLTSTLSAAGKFKFITTSGTDGDANVWEAGDIAIYLGSSGAYARVRPQRIILKPGEPCAFRISGQGVAFKAKSATGTPLLAKASVGAIEVSA